MALPRDNAAQPPDGAKPAGSAYPGKGFRLGEFVIKETLGHGSMATVFLAADPGGHEVALKIFQEGPGVSPTMLERFRREAEAAKKLRRHPNIMKVYATGKEGPYHYIVMEAIRNSRTLEDALEVTPMTIAEIVTHLAKIARALHYAHTRSIVHRDVKPSNIMMDEFGEPLLSDFGVAALIDWPSCTISGALTGTPLYMSPEQARAERVGPASDIYSLGVVLYEALTGVLPYSTQHAAPVKNVLEAVKNEPPRRPRFFRKDISRNLEAVILKALEKKPENRYDDAEALAVDLERALSGRKVTAHFFSYWEHLLHLARRYDQFFVAAVVMLAMLGGAGWFFRQQVLKARYEQLLTMVHLRNFATRITQMESPDGIARDTPAAWHEIRLARRSMATANWQAARNGFRTAIELSRNVGDGRTAAMAELDLARCETLLANMDESQRLYRDLLKNPDAPPTVSELAQLESLIVALLRNDRPEAIEVLSLRKLPSEGPVRDAIRCLAGEMELREFQGRLDGMPQRLRNDALLAAAIRHRLDGQANAFQQQLKRCLQVSSPATEWPAPLARMLLQEGGGS